MTYNVSKRIVTTIVGLTVTALPLAGCATTTPAPSPAPVHQVTEDSQGWNCLTMGNHICGHVLAVWTEHKADGSTERIGGYADQAPAGSTDFSYGTVTSWPQS